MRSLIVVGVAVLVLGSCAGGGGSGHGADTAVGADTAAGDTLPGLDAPEPDGDVMAVDSGSDVVEPDAAALDDAGGGPFLFSVDHDPSQQRGPVVLWFGPEGTDPAEAIVSAEWRDGTDGPWAPCTPLNGYQGVGKYVWDSMADTQDDLSSVSLRLEMVTDTGEHGVSSAEPFALYNDPARARQVLITHDINGDDRVRQLTWTHGVGMGGVGGDPAGLVHTVGASPRRVAFSPNGALAVVVEEGSEHLRILRFDLDTGALSGPSTLPAPGLYPVDAEFSGDGADLYVVHSNPGPEGGIYRVPIRPVGGGALDGQAFAQIHAQFQAGDLEVLPEGGGLALLAADPTGNADGIHLSVLSRDGAVLGTLGIGPEGSAPRAVAASPDGEWLLVSYFNFFGAGDRVVLVSLDAAGVPLAVNDVAVGDPEEPAWTGDSLTALITEAMDNKVTGLALDGGILAKGSSFSLGLAARVAHPTWGPDRDRFLVTTVSSGTGQSGLAVVEIAAGGQVTNTGTYDLGTGNDKIPGDVAIQP
jgi:hypothetical protein